MPRGVLVYAEEFMLAELACAANEISRAEPVYALAFGKPVEANGFDKVFVVEGLSEYNTDLYAAAAVQVIKEIDPSIILVGATNLGRDLAPRIASELQTGLTADCTDLSVDENGRLEATRPTFGGQLMAVIKCKTDPQMATVRPKVFKPIQEKKTPEIIYFTPDLPQPRVELLDFVKSVRELNELEHAQVVVAGGVGMKNADGFKMLEKLAKILGGAVGSTRLAVAKGFAPSSTQIGQTGLTVSPRLYIACGLSGAVQHTIGMCNSDKIVAINIDPAAPIFETCDIGYVGDVFEVVPQLIEAFTEDSPL